VLVCARKGGAPGLAGLDVDHVLAVDTGGDVLVRSSGGRDQRMLDALLSCGVPVTLAVVAPGSDGQETREALAAGAAALQGRCRGVLDLAALVPWLREAAPALVAYERRRGIPSTVTIARKAVEDAADGPIVVPRERRPAIPARWLRRAWFFEVAGPC